MAMIEHNTLPLGAVTIHRAVSGIVAIGDRFTRWLEVRRTVRLLGELDEAQLKDLGLTRGDIADFARRGRF